MFLARPSLALAGLLGLLTAAGFGSSDANAQQIYRSITPDGRTTFSDRVPTEANVRSSAPVTVRAPSAGSGALPLELHQLTGRYPVTLYTGPGCVPCDSGRALLSQRGIPFTELTVTTNEDIEALKRLAGAPSLPFLTIGGQHIKGFSDTEWVQFLDAAGYPKTSQLPAGYSPPPASPLVAAQPAQPPAPTAAESERAAAPQPELAPAQNPAGIRF